MARKAKKRFWAAARKVLYAGAGVTALLFSHYSGAKYPSTVKRIEDSLFYMNVPIAKDGFPDPAGLDVRAEINENGAKETYLVHLESGKKVSIGYDMLPKRLDVLAEGLENRLSRPASSFAEPDDTTRYRDALDKLNRTADRALQSYSSAISIIRNGEQKKRN